MRLSPIILGSYVRHPMYTCCAFHSWEEAPSFAPLGQASFFREISLKKKKFYQLIKNLRWRGRRNKDKGQGAFNVPISKVEKGA